MQDITDSNGIKSRNMVIMVIRTVSRLYRTILLIVSDTFIYYNYRKYKHIYKQKCRNKSSSGMSGKLFSVLTKY